MAVLQIAVTIGGFWTTEDKAEAFFEKLEKKQEKLKKKKKSKTASKKNWTPDYCVEGRSPNH
jgi:hypothetical protein